MHGMRSALSHRQQDMQVIGAWGNTQAEQVNGKMSGTFQMTTNSHKRKAIKYATQSSFID